MPTLTIQLPGLPPVEHILREEAITLGRMKGNTIAMDDVSVSLSHAKITRIGDDYILKDLNSTNGTMLNGQSINEARLRNGDQLKFGEVVAIFRLEAAKPASAPVAPLVPTELPPAVAHTVTNLIPAATPAKRPSPQPAPQPAAAPRTSVAAPVSPTATKPKAPAAKKNLKVLVVPVLAGGAALAVVGAVIWGMMGGDPNESAPPPSAPAKQTVAVAPSAQKPKPGGSSKRTNAVAASNAPKVTNATAATKPAAAQPAAPTPPPVVAVPAVVPTNKVPEPAIETDNPALAELLIGLRAADVAQRRRAAESISSFEGSAKDAVPALRVALKDADGDVRMWSALALVANQTYDKATIPILVQALRRDAAAVRQAACISLALVPCDEKDKASIVPALTTVAMRDQSEEVRKDAMMALRVVAPETIRGD